MIAIDQVLLSDEIVEEEFVCDLHQCKGGCCVDGDCGAPLADDEIAILADIYPKIKAYLSEESHAIIEQEGTHVWDEEFGAVTPTIHGGVCVYALSDTDGIVKCGIEKAWNEGVVDFRKPISCHLFPIRIKQKEGYELVNYEPREVLCKPACKLGKKLKVPVYQFLKEAIIRKYGKEFYDALDAVGIKLRSVKRL